VAQVITGTWDLAIKTPIGSLAVVYEFTETGGTATHRDETVAVCDLVIADGRATWRQSVTKPMRLNLDFDVTIDGDRMTGHSRAGRLPRTAVSGVRR
jgi:hypothetical protein